MNQRVPRAMADSKFRRAIRFLGSIALALAMSGCSRPLSTVGGRVYFEDQPVTGGMVVFYCEGQQIVRSSIAPDGTYSIPNVPRGTVRVTVAPPIRMPEGMKRKYPLPPVNDGPIQPESGPATKGARTPSIPSRYGVPEESGLTFNVDGSANEFDIRLKR